MEEFVPEDHLVRKMEEALKWDFIYPLVEPLYSLWGRPSIDPVILFKMIFINYTFNINSMRRTCEEIRVNLAYRWFLGISIDEAVPNYSTWSQNYIRRYGECFRMVEDLNITDRVRFFPRMPYQQMMAYTQLAELGFCLDKDTNLNYRFSLPNKLFDFIQAGVPIVASHLTEIEKIIRQYDIGLFVGNHEPETISSTIREALSDGERRKRWQRNLAIAAAELCWENEEKKLLPIYMQKTDK